MLLLTIQTSKQRVIFLALNHAKYPVMLHLYGGKRPALLVKGVTYNHECSKRRMDGDHRGQ